MTIERIAFKNPPTINSKEEYVKFLATIIEDKFEKLRPGEYDLTPPDEKNRGKLSLIVNPDGTGSFRHEVLPQESFINHGAHHHHHHGHQTTLNNPQDLLVIRNTTTPIRIYQVVRYKQD